MAESSWRNYEEVARDLLNRFAEHFGLERVEEKSRPGAAALITLSTSSTGVARGLPDTLPPAGRACRQSDVRLLVA